MSNKQNEQINTPAGAGGLIRFSDEYPSKLQVSPEWIMIAIVIVIIGAATLKIFLKI